TTLPPDHSSAFLPSKRTTAPSGGFFPAVGLWRDTRLRVNSSPLSVLPLRVWSAGLIVAVQPPPLTATPAFSSISAALGSVPALTLALPSQPAPGSPPCRK